MKNLMTESKVRDITETVIKTLLQKNQDYGGASFDLGAIGNMVHIWDKTMRYRSLVEKSLKGGAPNFESTEDTLRDLIGYAIIGIIILENEGKIE